MLIRELNPSECAEVLSVGQKVEWMRQNPKVCLEVEEIVTGRRAERDRA